MRCVLITPFGAGRARGEQQLGDGVRAERRDARSTAAPGRVATSSSKRRAPPAAGTTRRWRRRSRRARARTPPRRRRGPCPGVQRATISRTRVVVAAQAASRPGPGAPARRRVGAEHGDRCSSELPDSTISGRSGPRPRSSSAWATRGPLARLAPAQRRPAAPASRRAASTRRDGARRRRGTGAPCSARGRRAGPPSAAARCRRRAGLGVDVRRREDLDGRSGHDPLNRGGPRRGQGASCDMSPTVVAGPWCSATPYPSAP